MTKITYPDDTYSVIECSCCHVTSKTDAVGKMRTSYVILDNKARAAIALRTGDDPLVYVLHPSGDPAACYGCGICRTSCATDAITLKPRAEQPVAAKLW